MTTVIERALRDRAEKLEEALLKLIHAITAQNPPQTTELEQAITYATYLLT
jgi:hypothetical protein